MFMVVEERVVSVDSEGISDQEMMVRLIGLNICCGVCLIVMFLWYNDLVGMDVEMLYQQVLSGWLLEVIGKVEMEIKLFFGMFVLVDEDNVVDLDGLMEVESVEIVMVEKFLLVS